MSNSRDDVVKPTPKVETRECFVFIQMKGGVERMVGTSTEKPKSSDKSASNARNVGRIAFVLESGIVPEFAEPFFRACKDGVIPDSTKFGLFERQIRVNLDPTAQSAARVPAKPATRRPAPKAPTAPKPTGWRSMFGRSGDQEAGYDASRAEQNVDRSDDQHGNSIERGGEAPTAGEVGSNAESSAPLFPKAPSAAPQLRHNEPFVLSGRPESSEIMITTESATALDGKWIVFGRVVDSDSQNVVKRVKRYAADGKNRVFIGLAGEGDGEGKKPGLKSLEVQPKAALEGTGPGTSAGATTSSEVVGST